MAELNNRIDTFVTLLLDVSGRARPTDLQGVRPDEAAEVLRLYAAAHPGLGLRFEGDTLVAAPPGAAPAASAVEQAAGPEHTAPTAFELPAPAGIQPESPPLPAHEASMFEAAIPVPVPEPEAQPAYPAADPGPEPDDLGLPPLEDEARTGSRPGTGARPSPLLIVLLVILLIVAAIAAAYYLGAFEALGLS